MPRQVRQSSAHYGRVPVWLAERMNKYEGMTVMGKAQPPMPKKNQQLKLF